MKKKNITIIIILVIFGYFASASENTKKIEFNFSFSMLSLLSDNQINLRAMGNEQLLIQYFNLMDTSPNSTGEPEEIKSIPSLSFFINYQIVAFFIDLSPAVLSTRI